MTKIIKKEFKYKKCEYTYLDDTLKTYNNMDDEKIDINSQFRIGSMSKMLVMIAFLISKDNKMLQLSDNVSKYIPSNKNNDFDTINIEDDYNYKFNVKLDKSLEFYNCYY